MLFEFFEDPRAEKGNGDKSSLYVDEDDEPFVGVADRKKTLDDKLNKQIAHLDKDGRLVHDDPERIRENDLRAMYDLIRDELANFKRHLLPALRLTLPDLAPRHAELSSPTTSLGPITDISIDMPRPR